LGVAVAVGVGLGLAFLGAAMAVDTARTQTRARAGYAMNAAGREWRGAVRLFLRTETVIINISFLLLQF
jgi:hypothetical protein